MNTIEQIGIIHTKKGLAVISYHSNSNEIRENWENGAYRTIDNIYPHENEGLEEIQAYVARVYAAKSYKYKAL